jgi:hypothetical protein
VSLERCALAKTGDAVFSWPAVTFGTIGMWSKLRNVLGFGRSRPVPPEETNDGHVEPLGEEPIKGFQPAYQGTDWYDEHRPPK